MMITLLIGKKGSGKTKKLIELANAAIAATNGNVVVIEKGLKLTYDISHQARLIDTDAYGISGAESMIGFLSGICAGNYDVTDILVDSTLKIIGADLQKLSEMVEKLVVLSDSANTKIVLSVSAAAAEIPENLVRYIAE
ncbi:MAG: hypothetical protein RSC76_05705 [Oscillospiraceae bacterium]